MSIYGIALLIIFIVFGMIVGVATHFYQNMGSNIGRNHLRDWGLDDTENEDDLKR